MNMEFSTAIASRPLHLRRWETKLAVYKVLLWGFMSLVFRDGMWEINSKS